MNFRPLVLLLGAVAVSSASTTWAATPALMPPLPSDPSVSVPNASAPSKATSHEQPGELVVHRGQRLSQALEEFAKTQGWTVLWYCQDWAAPGRTVFHGDFLPVSKEFIQSIAADGADIHGKWWLGNKTLVVTGSGAMQ